MGTQYQPDGLPNITGTQYGCGHDGYMDCSGAIYKIGGAYGGMSSMDWNNPAWGFNANLSNAIYGNSQYVQPKSVSILPIIKY